MKIHARQHLVKTASMVFVLTAWGCSDSGSAMPEPTDTATVIEDTSEVPEDTASPTLDALLDSSGPSEDIAEPVPDGIMDSVPHLPDAVGDAEIFDDTQGPTPDVQADAGPPAPLLCGDVPEATSEMAAAGSIETLTNYLLCTDMPEGGACPALDALSPDFALEVVGHPWADSFCWYDAEPICGPETAILDRCCYEVAFGMVACS